LDPATLARLEWPVARVRQGMLETAIVYVDSFGNIKLVGEVADLEAALGALAPDDPLRLRWTDGSGEQTVVVPWVETFGRVPKGAPLAYEDAYGRICLAANQASGALVLGLHEGLSLSLSRA
jgi:S-adenosylmethionine hydrolase